jgi:hypothetical protein
MTGRVPRVWADEAGRGGGCRGPPEDESGASVCRVRDEKEGDERLHPLVEISAKAPLSFDFCSVENGQVFQDCLRLFGEPANNNHQLSLWLKSCLWLAAPEI